MSGIVPMESRPDRLWREFCEARDKAQRSNAVEDGIAAGRAWSRFLAEFVGDRDLRASVHGIPARPQQ